MKKAISILLFLISINIIAQEFANRDYYLIDSLTLEKLSKSDFQLVDSCLKLYHKATDDTSKINAINTIVETSFDFYLWPKYNQWVYEYTTANLKDEISGEERIVLQSCQAGAINNIGFVYGELGNIEKQIEFYKKALNIFEEIEDLKGISGGLNNIGAVFDNQGKVDLALEYYFKSLKISQKIQDRNEVAVRYNNIATIYHNQGKIEEALEYHFKSLKIKEEIGNHEGAGYSYNNLGYIYLDLNDSLNTFNSFNKGVNYFQKSSSPLGIALAYNSLGVAYEKYNNPYLASIYYNKSLKIYDEIGSTEGKAIAYNNIGGLYKKGKKYDEALNSYFNSLTLFESINQKKYSSKVLHNLGQIYLLKNDLNKANTYAVKSKELSDEIGYPSNIMDASELLSKIYEKQGKGIQALEMYKVAINMRDSINNESTQKTAAKQQAKYEYEKQKALDDAENDKKVALEKEKQKRQFTVLIISISGSFLVVLLLLIIYRRLRITKKQKVIIEEAHQEITDSINYAERIQRSFLATKEILDENLQNYFVFFKPKDVVSGDFYWARKLSNGNFAIVNADSTGHGVPGAIMSILNISSIEKAVEQGINEPFEIFNHARNTIIERLKKDGSDEGGKDGMDASIISFDFTNSKFTYTAANNPIWIIRNKEVIQIKPDKMPVGKHDSDSVSFTQGEFILEKGDQVYTLTDGFQDQFGGSKGKKFMVKKMREYILSISHYPMEEQYKRISEVFETWKGDLEQVDDVCLIGLKV